MLVELNEKGRGSLWLLGWEQAVGDQEWNQEDQEGGSGVILAPDDGGSERVE